MFEDERINEACREDDEDSIITSSRNIDSSVSCESTDTKRSDSSSVEEFAAQETKAVCRLRCFAILVLFSTATVITAILFLFTRRAELREFEIQFDGTSDIILDRFMEIVTNHLGAISSLAIAVTAHGADNARSWPFVTLPSFPERAAAALDQSHGLYLEFAPLVDHKNRYKWESYSVLDEHGWLNKALQYENAMHTHEIRHPLIPHEQYVEEAVFNSGYVFYRASDGAQVLDKGPGPYLPAWQISPVFENMINENVFMDEDRGHEALLCFESESIVIGDLHYAQEERATTDSSRLTKFFSAVLSNYYGEPVDYEGDPMSYIYIPVFDSFGENRTATAVLSVLINWGIFFEAVLPHHLPSVAVVLENSCTGNGGESYTYNVHGHKVDRIGEGDLHDTQFSFMEQVASYRTLKNIADGTTHGLKLNQQDGECFYKLKVYPTSDFYAQYVTSGPYLLTFAVGMTFVFTMFVFICYNRVVERRQKIVLTRALHSTAIVSSIFPKNVRDRVMEAPGDVGKNGKYLASKQKIKSFLNGDSIDDQPRNDQIADLFPYATVLFADIAGFTAWSSTRDPEQVFTLLQTIYSTFDDIATRRNVFKVETVGDSYVAVTGLPEPQDRHAVIMARFAFDCVANMYVVFKELEKSLGPDTAELSMRFGIHSGPVTAGVLRGQNCRFQIFGDTVNTASRMESTGIPGKIQISQSTAELLIQSGKGHWVKAREDSVLAKGKGVLDTWWLEFHGRKHTNSSGGSMTASNSSDQGNVLLEHQHRDLHDVDKILEKHGRLINWITDILKDHIKQILMKRKAMGVRVEDCGSVSNPVNEHQIPIDEIVEAINLPVFDPKVARRADRNSQQVDLHPEVVSQLHDYVAKIAATYRDNPFHNFEHACHVTMSVRKLLLRIVKPNLEILDSKQVAAELHNYTHGINSDPLTLFAIVFSALIHDVDHRGVSNAQLIKEDGTLGTVYREKSVAEQNSLTIAWDLLMSGDYGRLRDCLFANQADVLRFRQIVVNIILATDIFDKDYNELRKARWAKAFGECAASEACNDLRATVVMEHIIQASDVSHTMQHWHIYQKWNKCLLKEMVLAYRAGRSATDPSLVWYKGELSFFDNYIIPLARKLKDCNVFGVSSDECLNYALQNRAEWEIKGAQIVKDTMAELAETLGLHS